MNRLRHMTARIEALVVAVGDRLNVESDARVAESGWDVTVSGWGARSYRDPRTGLLPHLAADAATARSRDRDRERGPSLAQVIDLDAARALAARTGRPVHIAVTRPTGGVA